jgi:hypothetical protein
MKQFARLISLCAMLAISGVSLNTQALEIDMNFQTNLELQMARIKAEALTEVSYELKQQFKASKTLFLGAVAKPVATQMELAQHSVEELETVVTLAD